MNIVTSKTQADLLFEEYLTGAGLTAEYEPPLGVKRPDYLVHTRPHEVLCEVEEFGEGDVDRDEHEQLRMKGMASLALNPYSRIREKLDIGGRQLREFKGRFPCLVVLYNPGRLVNLGTSIVQGAMYGDIGVVIGVHPSVERPPVNMGTRFDPKTAKLRSYQNTTISAVAVLERVRPNAHMIENALAENRHRQSRTGWPTAEEFEEDLRIAEEIRREHPEVDLEVVRLRVIHNPYAALALSPEAFNREHDEQYRLDATGRFVRLPGG